MLKTSDILRGFVVGALLLANPAFAESSGVNCKPSGHDPAKLGLVVLHGKNTFGRGDGSFDILADFKTGLRGAGFRVAAPEMPWSRSRVYNRSYDEALEEIGRTAAELKAQGAERVVVIGHSLGANGALGYAAAKGGVAGIVALAPGHNPELSGFRKYVGDSVARARAMVASGKGDEQASFDDFNSGRVGTVRTTAALYLSYFDPDGRAVIPRNTAALPPNTPLLWIMGDEDPLIRLGQSYAYDRAPTTPLNRYIVVHASHIHVPTAAISIVVAWLKCL